MRYKRLNMHMEHYLERIKFRWGLFTCKFVQALQNLPSIRENPTSSVEEEEQKSSFVFTFEQLRLSFQITLRNVWIWHMRMKKMGDRSSTKHEF